MLTPKQREELRKNPGEPVMEYDYVNPQTGNRCHIKFYDAAYRDNTPEQNKKIWQEACRVAYQIDVNRQLREKGLPPAYQL